MMIYKSLTVNGLMNSDFSIDFAYPFTLIIGDNRAGKTKIFRSMMLAKFGLQERYLHDSWKLKKDELLPGTQSGYVELSLEKGGKPYTIRRSFYTDKPSTAIIKADDRVIEGDAKAKLFLDEELGITPSLANLYMTNEKSWIGALSYDEELQEYVWTSWQYLEQIIRENIGKSARRLGREVRGLERQLDEVGKSKLRIAERLIEIGVFSQDEVELLNIETIEKKLRELEKLKEREGYYKNTSDVMIYQMENIEDKDKLGSSLGSLGQLIDNLTGDVKQKTSSFFQNGKTYLQTLFETSQEGGLEKVKKYLEDLEDETKKLDRSKEVEKRREEAVSTTCQIYPPSEEKRLLVQLPDDITKEYTSEEIREGEIVCEYMEEEREKIEKEKTRLQELITRYDGQRSEFKTRRDEIRTLIKGELEELAKKSRGLEVLRTSKDDYLGLAEQEDAYRKESKRFEEARKYFGLLEGIGAEPPEVIKRATGDFTNRIFKRFGWDIVANLEGDRPEFRDSKNNLRTHISGSENNVMGFAWRWAMARSFDTPLCLDELDALFDRKNFAELVKLINDEVDRQTIILTTREDLKEELKEPKVYRVYSDENGISRMTTLV